MELIKNENNSIKNHKKAPYYTELLIIITTNEA